MARSLHRLAALCLACCAAGASAQDEFTTGVGILSKSSNRGHRDLIRNTWVKASKVSEGKVVPRFFVATSSLKEEHESLLAEAAEFGDVVVVPSPESYRFIAWQTLEVWRYFSGLDGYEAPAAPSAAVLSKPVDYVVKSDDDVFVNVDTLLAFLKTKHAVNWVVEEVGDGEDDEGDDEGDDEEAAEEDKGPAAVYCGHITYDSEPSRNLGHWGLSEEEYPEASYPPWAGGPAYLLSRPLFAAIAAEHARLAGGAALGSPSDGEDVTTGRGKSGAIASDGKGLRVLGVEDVSTALWVKHLKQRAKDRKAGNSEGAEGQTLVDVQYVDDRRFLRYRFCQEGAFTLLVEGGRQWPDREKAFTQYWANHEAITAGKRRRTCVAGGTPQDYEFRAAVKMLAEATGLGTPLMEGEVEVENTRVHWESFWDDFPEQKAAAKAMLFDRLEGDVMHYIKRSQRKPADYYAKYAAVAPVLSELVEDLRAELNEDAAAEDAAAEDAAEGSAQGSDHFDL